MTENLEIRYSLEIRKYETRPPSYTIYKNNPKCIKDLNVILKTIKLLKENIGSKSQTLLIAIFFLIYVLSQQETKEKIIKWYYLNLKNFCRVKKTITKKKYNPLNEKTYSLIHLIRG